jgi:hypothetical protein
VSSNATLAGTGTINGTVTIVPTGVLAPGTSAMGTLTVNSNLTLAGNINARVNRSGSASDQTIVSGILTNSGAGTVTVTNLGAALQPGDTFFLFNKALSNGVAMAVTGGSVIWSNKLAVDGSIAVLSAIATNPTNITFSVSGSTLALSWPADHLGWLLQTQTNPLTKGLNTNWFPVAGSTFVNQTNIAMNPTNGSVFFRLISQ